MADIVEQESNSPTLQILVENHARFAAFLRTRVHNPADAEEILQIAFGNASEQELTLRSDESAVAWFYRLLRNALIDFYRKQDTHRRHFDSDSPFCPDSAISDPELEETVCQCLHDIIPTMKPAYAELLQRVDLDGQRVDEVAKMLQISANNAAVRLHRARSALKNQLVQVCGACTTHGCLDCTCKTP